LDTSSSERTVQNREFIRSSAAINKVKSITINKLVDWISYPRTLIRQYIPVTERADPPKNKLFGVVACPKIGVTELSHPLDQSGQARCHL
jgi:hypothetical protein